MSDSELSELGFNLSMNQSIRSSTTSGTLPPCVVPPALGVVRLALRDTLVKGWLTGVYLCIYKHICVFIWVWLD